MAAFAVAGMDRDAALRALSGPRGDPRTARSAARSPEEGGRRHLGTGDPLAPRGVESSRRGRITYQKSESHGLLAAISLIVFAPAVQDERIILTNARVLSVSGEPMAKGSVVISGGKIVAVADNVVFPEAKVIDLSGKVIIPGLIDAGCHLGVAGPANGDGDEVARQMRIVVSLDPRSPDLARARQSGVTAAFVEPGNRGVIGGVASIVRTAGPSRAAMMIRESAAIKAAIGPTPAQQLPAAGQRSDVLLAPAHDPDGRGVGVPEGVLRRRPRSGRRSRQGGPRPGAGREDPGADRREPPDRPRNGDADRRGAGPIDLLRRGAGGLQVRRAPREEEHRSCSAHPWAGTAPDSSASRARSGSTPSRC
jgi:hypothetical protein